jgi:hypothetical protein
MMLTPHAEVLDRTYDADLTAGRGRHAGHRQACERVRLPIAGLSHRGASVLHAECAGLLPLRQSLPRYVERLCRPRRTVMVVANGGCVAAISVGFGQAALDGETSAPRQQQPSHVRVDWRGLCRFLLNCPTDRPKSLGSRAYLFGYAV